MQEGVFEQIEVDYLIAGHTRFHPDRYFAWLSNVVKKSDFFSLSDYVEVVEKNCRKLQLKETIMHEFESWTEKLKKRFKKIKDISKQQTFLIKKWREKLVKVSAAKGHGSSDAVQDIEVSDEPLPLMFKANPNPTASAREKIEIRKSLLEDLTIQQNYVFNEKIIKFED